MRDSIIVSISELRSLVQDARRTGKQYVQLSILEPLDDSDGGEPVGQKSILKKSRTRMVIRLLLTHRNPCGK